jgi:acylphosphatase
LYGEDIGMEAAGNRSVHLRVTGRVQGVFYRAWTAENARACGLAGWVRNRHDGSVEAVFSGPHNAVEAMIERCAKGPRAARVDTVTILGEGCDAGSSFEIRPDA